MIKTIKVQLKPNNKQRTELFKMSGTARFAYNWALTKQQENYKQGNKFLNENALRKEFTIFKQQESNCWLEDVSNNVTKQAIKDACDAYMRFFKKQADYPCFKTKRKSKPSFYQDTIKIRFTGTHVKLEKIAKSKKRNKAKLNWVRLVEKNRIPFGENVKYYNPRITFDGLNWWISVGVDSEVVNYSSFQSEGVGIDLGLKELAVTSNNDRFNNINKSKVIKRLEKRKRRLQRGVSRKYLINKKGERYIKTRNIIKSEKELLKIHKRLTNIRQNYLHQITTAITNRKPKFVVLEDLNVKGMMKNKHLSKALKQQCFYEFRRQIEYKCKWNSIEFILADRWYPSSKLCSCCGKIKKDLKLSERIYVCGCGNKIDRDYQASINLKQYGERVLKSAI